MNLTINPINFNIKNLALTKKQNNEQKSCAQKELAGFNASIALKNQILFKGIEENQQRRELIQETIEQYSLPIKPQTLDFVLKTPADEDGLYLKYSKTGSKFFELFSRYIFHKNYPIKSESELTDAVVFFIKNQNKARIINDFIPENLLPKTDNKETTQANQANCLNALLGAIIYENDDGFKTAFNFLNDLIGKNIFPKDLEINEKPFEKLANLVEQKGYSREELYQEIRFFNEKWHYRIHYKDIVLAQTEGEKRNSGAKKQCVESAIEKIESGEIDLSKAGENLTYTNYKKPTPKRIEELEDFCQKWDLNFNDFTLLHKAFLYGEMQDGSALAHCDSYETLEYIGDAVLGFCVHEILQNNLAGISRREISAKRHYFTRNENLILLAKEINLPSYAINRNGTQAAKRPADMFEALIGAIFLDGKENGIDNAYKFLDANFRDRICNQTY